jgi:hypothetical protein
MDLKNNSENPSTGNVQIPVGKSNQQIPENINTSPEPKPPLRQVLKFTKDEIKNSSKKQLVGYVLDLQNTYSHLSTIAAEENDSELDFRHIVPC